MHISFIEISHKEEQRNRLDIGRRRVKRGCLVFVTVVCLPHDWGEPLESEKWVIRGRLKRGKICWRDASPEVGR